MSSQGAGTWGGEASGQNGLGGMHRSTEELEGVLQDQFSEGLEGTAQGGQVHTAASVMGHL